MSSWLKFMHILLFIYGLTTVYVSINNQVISWDNTFMLFTGIVIIGSTSLFLTRDHLAAKKLQTLKKIGIPITTFSVKSNNYTLKNNRGWPKFFFTQGIYNGTEQMFKSAPLWKNPKESFKEKPVTVYIDPSFNKNYAMDLEEFL